MNDNVACRALLIHSHERGTFILLRIIRHIGLINVSRNFSTEFGPPAMPG